MRISDWSSDVCSSDLDPLDVGQQVEAIGAVDQRRHRGRAELRVALSGAEMKDLVAYRRQPLRGQYLREQLGQPRAARIDQAARGAAVGKHVEEIGRAHV